jgi:hypothetical protein
MYISPETLDPRLKKEKQMVETVRSMKPDMPL